MKNLKYNFGSLYLSLAAMALFTFAFASCSKDDDKVETLKFNVSKAEVAVGKTATVTVSGGTAPYVVESGDVKLATAAVTNNTITVTGVKQGTATLTVTDKNKIVGKLSVVVSGLDFDKKTLTIAPTKEDVVTVTGGVAPYSVEVKDAAIATATVADNKITIKGVKAGTTTITVADKDKSNSGTISVTIK